VIGKLGPADFTNAEGRELFRRCFPLLKETGHLEHQEFDLVGRDGTLRRVGLTATVLRGPGGELVCTRTVLHDVTARVRAEARVAAESARFKAYLRVAVDGVCILDRSGKLVEASDSFATMLGYDHRELIGERPSRWDERCDLEAIVSKVLAGVLRQFETVHRRKDGTTLDVEVRAEVFEYDGGRYIFCASRDISGRKRDERRMLHMATHDALTRLPNRTLFRDRLSRALVVALRRGTHGALLMLDLDGFKLVNDRYGHEAGDKVLKVVASRLNARVRRGESVARIGGDEFAIVLDDINDEQDIRTFANQVMHDVSRPLALDNGSLVAVGASVGAAPFPAAGRSRRTLLAAADRAMYASKLSGRNSCTISAEQGDAGDSGALLFDTTVMPRTGLAPMDDAHDSLADLVGSVELAMDAGASGAELDQKLGDQAAYTSSHFEEEERWMAQLDYPDGEAHELAHHQLLEELALLRSGLADGQDNSLLQVLKDWIVIHIGAFDGPLARYIVDNAARDRNRQSAL
jgi:diguanylate cyclase (GGDEF)-like protein/hemerythrin-like metal-binding protein/PAS domain S-box-containing protein